MRTGFITGTRSVKQISNQMSALKAIDYLQQLPEPVKSQALEAVEEQKLETANMECFTLSMALSVAFLWDNTKQGRSYWLNIASKLLVNF